MEPEDRVHAVQRPLLHEDLRAPADTGLLRRLKDEAHRPAELLPKLRQDAGGRDEPRHVSVMPAGVHHPVRLRPVFHVVLLLDGQRVDIRPERHAPTRPCARLFARDLRRQAAVPSAESPAQNFDALDLPQFFLDAVRCLELLPGQLRMPVKIPPQRD